MALDFLKKDDKQDSQSTKEEDLLAFFDEYSDVEIIMLESYATEAATEILDNLLESDDFYEHIDDCLMALHALYIHRKVLKSRDIENKTLGDFQKEYQDLQKKWNNVGQ